jgi:hypothetical protein
MPPTSCFFSTRFVWNPFFLWAGALLFDKKIRQGAALFWFGLRNVGILLLTSRPPKNNCRLTYWEPDLAEKICGLCPYNQSAEEVGGLDGFLHDAAQNFEVL